MKTREREPSDLEDLIPIARVIHADDGYPPYLPDGDLAGFLFSPEAIAGWVAIVEGRVVGHVALHARSSEKVMVAAADSLGVSPDRLCVISRLLVDPTQRRTGVARRLLGVACRDAAERGLVPILDVVQSFAPAIALYEREGWRRLAAVTVSLPDGTTFDEYVYRGPEPGDSLR